MTTEPCRWHVTGNRDSSWLMTAQTPIASQIPFLWTSQSNLFRIAPVTYAIQLLSQRARPDPLTSQALSCPRNILTSAKNCIRDWVLQSSSFEMDSHWPFTNDIVGLTQSYWSSSSSNRAFCLPAKLTVLIKQYRVSLCLRASTHRPNCMQPFLRWLWMRQ